MISAFGGKNCWAFKDWFEINMRINKNVPSEYGFRDIPIVPIMCFEGPNASGKTCALKVLSFIVEFCKNSFSYAPEAAVPFDSFFHNEDDSSFFISFLLNSDLQKEYTYEVTFSKKKISRERLYSVKGRVREVLFLRTKSRVTRSVFPSINLRDNASFISTMNQYGIKEIAPFFNFFKNFYSNIVYAGRAEENTLFDPAAYYQSNPDMLKKVLSELRKMDAGIADIRISEFTDQNNTKQYYSVVYSDTDNGPKPLNHWTMSTGTKLLYSKLNIILEVLSSGGVMLFDELDCHLHSSLVPIILDYFLNPDKNINNAQLFFTSHDSSLLDSAKKYRTYLFEKHSGESICYRIDELPANLTSRNDRSLEQVYKSGVIGGLPNV
ncbi:MAG: ATP-binding protein [Spirochaetales bacterium]|nr:ATP-binding protein [Spirochaetales bacterium]MBQ7281178.1 ATP-binding protein [Spirochaetales bacterium]